jgi:hypothetical protein
MPFRILRRRTALLAALAGGALALSLAGEASPATADEITGGFGFTLGATFDPAGARSEGRSISNDLYYLVKSPAPEAPLDQYGLHITPATHRIAVIFGAKEFPERAACETARDAFKSRMTQTFGAPFVAPNIPGAVQFGAARRFAMLECKGRESPFVFQVTFADVELMMLFQNERLGLGR